MDVPEGQKRPVVEAYLTDEVKQHETILSYSSEFYSSDMEMITGAEVYAVGAGDTIRYYEQLDNPYMCFTMPCVFSPTSTSRRRMPSCSTG